MAVLNLSVLPLASKGVEGLQKEGQCAILKNEIRAALRAATLAKIFGTHHRRKKEGKHVRAAKCHFEPGTVRLPAARILKPHPRKGTETTLGSPDAFHGTILKPHPRKGTETRHFFRKDCVMSNTVTIRLSDEERKMLDVVAQAHDCKVPSLMKRFALEKVEDEYDISIFEKYEKQDAEGRMKTRPIDAFFAECGL